MSQHVIRVEPATPAAVAPFGRFIGAHADLPVFAAWPGVVVTGPAPIEIGSGGEVLHVRMQAATFPARVALLERHFKHTQTYLSANGRPFVMVLGAAGSPLHHPSGGPPPPEGAPPAMTGVERRGLTAINRREKRAGPGRVPEPGSWPSSRWGSDRPPAGRKAPRDRAQPPEPGPAPGCAPAARRNRG